ncbi:hypothetical protein ACFWXO_34065 [Kitasatospora sp. NPDC059088]
MSSGSPWTPCALLATRYLTHHPGATIAHDVLTSAGTREMIHEHGGRLIRSRVGHSHLKHAMLATGAALGGESSGHYYFGDFWHADSGPLAALHTIAALGHQPLPASRLLSPFTRYVTSGEINLTVPDPQATLETVKGHFAHQGDHLDGPTVTYGPATWFNLRPSNVYPVLRLTIEAPSRRDVEDLRQQVLALLIP